MRINIQPLAVIVMIFFAACNSKAPNDVVKQKEELPNIFPDYANVTIPPNIAPLNFYIEEKGDEFLVELINTNGKHNVIKQSDPKIQFKSYKWRKLLKENQGKSIKVIVYVKKSNEGWIKYKAFDWNVANEEIDSYLAYRLINVGYVLWKKMGLYQRDLTSFKETAIMINRNSDGNCMNCHSFSHNNAEYLMFHMRGKNGGTLISTPDSTFKIDTKTAMTISAGAYPSWHPSGKYIAFSLDLVRQFFHGVDMRNEVYDEASDIVIYDIEKNTIITSPLVSTPLREALPNWSPDGKYLYFSRAPEFSDTLLYDETYYDLMRIEFDVTTNTWGKLDTLLLSNEIDGTISFPKASPDGKYVLFTKASHGYFTIFNKTSDLYFLELATGNIFPYEFNSNNVDSYHTWSSNSRWFVFSSKQINGLTTRPFIAYIDENGKAQKPFVMPQKDPLFYQSFATNYNVPELTNSKININKQDLLKAVKGKAQLVKNTDIEIVDIKSEEQDSTIDTSLH